MENNFNKKLGLRIRELRLAKGINLQKKQNRMWVKPYG